MVLQLAGRATGRFSNAADAQDATQMAFEKVWQNLAGFRGEYNSSFPAWVATIAARSYLEICRKNEQRSVGVPVEQLPDTASKRFTTPCVNDMQMWSAIDQLPPRLRTALVLRKQFGYEYDEIADLMDIRSSTVKEYVLEARKRVDDLIRGADPDLPTSPPA